jgi:putative membrane protein
MFKAINIFMYSCSIAALTLFSTYSLAGEPASVADKVFVGKVSQGGMYEVEASKIAEQKAIAQDVKDQANTEVHDHELVNAKLKQIATAHGIAVASTLNQTFQQRLDKLKNNSGSDFDAAYITDMQQIHANDEKLFAQESMIGTDAFRPFAYETDHIVKRHIGALHGLDK